MSGLLTYARGDVVCLTGPLGNASGGPFVGVIRTSRRMMLREGTEPHNP